MSHLKASQVFLHLGGHPGCCGLRVRVLPISTISSHHPKSYGGSQMIPAMLSYFQSQHPLRNHGSALCSTSSLPPTQKTLTFRAVPFSLAPHVAIATRGAPSPHSPRPRLAPSTPRPPDQLGAKSSGQRRRRSRGGGGVGRAVHRRKEKQWCWLRRHNMKQGFFVAKKRN